MPPFADPANLVRREIEEEPIPDNIPLQVIADEVVRGKRQLSRDQMRLLIELLPYYLSKLPTTTHVNFNYAEQLEKELRAIERSKQAIPLLKVIDGTVEQVSAAEMKRPFPQPRRSFRRY